MKESNINTIMVRTKVRVKKVKIAITQRFCDKFESCQRHLEIQKVWSMVTGSLFCYVRTTQIKLRNTSYYKKLRELYF